MCKNAEFNTGKVSLTTQKRKDLATELDISPQTLSNSLTSLKKSKLIDGNNGEFQINPLIF
jgi:predicted transcriptional regulator